jgi:hypothetical protein
LFFSIANEGGDISAAFDELKKALSAGAPKGFAWSSARYTDEDHNSSALRAHYAGLRAIFVDWPMPQDARTGLPAGGLAGVEQHYRALSKHYGYSVSAEATINALGYSLLSSMQQSDALAAFQRNAELYPGSANVYDSLADAYEAGGKLDFAMQNVQKAVEIATHNGDPALSIFSVHLDRLTKAVKAAPTKGSEGK